MSEHRSSFLPAFLTLVGSIIGAGIFGVPAVLRRVGLVPGSIIFWIVALLLLATHLLFLEIISRDRRMRRLPGYAGHVLGHWAERVGVATHSFHVFGANLAYLILGGEFLALLGHRIGLNYGMLTWQMVFWVGGILTVIFGLRIMSVIESWMTWMLLTVMLVMIGFASVQMDFAADQVSHTFQATTALGVFLFSLSGFTVIPEVYEIAKKRIRQARLAVTFGSLTAALLTWLFGVSIYLGAQGADLSSIPSLSVVFPSSLWWLLPVCGFLAVATSFITSAFDLQSMFHYDLKLGRGVAAAITLGLPVVLLCVTSRNYLATIDTAGSVFGAANGILIAASAMVAMHASKGNRLSFWWVVVVPVLSMFLFASAIVQRLLGMTLH